MVAKLMQVQEVKQVQEAELTRRRNHRRPFLPTVYPAHVHLLRSGSFDFGVSAVLRDDWREVAERMLANRTLTWLSEIVVADGGYIVSILAGLF